MKFIKKALTEIINILITLLSVFIKRRSNMIMFGSWKGEKVADNSRYLMEYILSNYPDYKCCWAISDCNNPDTERYPNVKFVKINSLEQIKYALKCKFFFVTQPINADISRYKACWRGAVTTYLGHGVGIKHIKKGYNLFHNYSYYSVQNSRSVKNSYKLYDSLNDDKIIKTGSPRSDYIYNADDKERERVKLKFSEKYSFSPDKKVITYMPTFRQNGAPIKSLLEYGQTSAELLDILKTENCVLIEKFHKTTLNQNSFINAQNADDIIVNIDNSIETQELLLITDVLICDYSSALVDFVLTDKNALFFVYDYDFYKNDDQGLFYTVDEFAYGPIVYDVKKLPSELNKLLCSPTDEYSDKRKNFAEKICEFESGNSCKNIFEKVILQNND